MDATVDLSTGIWVEVVPTVGVGAVGIRLEGIGWVNTLTLYLLLASMVLFLLSLVLGPGAFLVMGLLFLGGALVLGCGWVGHGWVFYRWVCGWGLGLGPSLPSSSKYIFIFWKSEG